MTVAALTAAQLTASAQLVAHLGDIELQANQAGQVFDFFVENQGDDPITGIDGISFVLQVGDGSSGPVIQAVNLKYGDSIFEPAAYTQSGPVDGSTHWYAGYSIDSDGSHPATLPAHSPLSILARVTFDTTGLDVGAGPWTASLTEDTFYSLNAGTGAIMFDLVTGGTMTIVPEPAAYAAVMGVLMVGFAGWRRMKRAK